ncbi:hypothetical protein ACJMK2_020544 [Sinanodonta woodiana]|uniref:Uncharacterized protein n=1 Tax=Sinanodonta woodiana TaxID=1069815 RepID=A0ABD3U270_SINWO
MTFPTSQRLTIVDLSRVSWNEKPLRSTSLANKTMTYLDESIKPTRMMRQYGSSQLPLDRVSNLQPKEMPRCNSSLKSISNGDHSIVMCQRGSALSSKKDKCKYFWEQSYLSVLDDKSKQSLLDKEL